MIGSDDEVAGRLKVYVGESDNLGKRLRQHAINKDLFDWEFACAITSKDQNLTKSHVLFLEAAILQKSLVADRATFTNVQSNIYDNIPESDISDMTYFFEQLAVLLPALGVELFVSAELQQGREKEQNLPANSETGAAANSQIIRTRSLQPSTGPDAIEVILKDLTFGIEARGLESNGEILVLKGSHARGVNDNKTNVYSQLRERLRREGKLVATEDIRVLKFASDVVFNSPSAASAVILDRNDNGRNSWKERVTGMSLNDWYARRADLARLPTAPRVDADETS